MHKRHVLAWSLWGVTIVISLISLVLRTSNSAKFLGSIQGAEWWLEVLFWAVLIPLAAPAFATAGAFIAAQLPQNPVGWLCLALAMVIGLQDLLWQLSAWTYGYNASIIQNSAWLPWVMWFTAMITALELPPLPFMLLLLRFPNGRLPSKNWRWVEGIILVVFVLRVLLAVLRSSYSMIGPETPNPLGITGPSWGLEFSNRFVVPAAYSLLLLALAAPVIRWRSASGRERLQIKWLAYVSGLILLAALSAGLTLLLQPQSLYAPVFLGALALAGACLGIPAAIAIAILKYRLYDIDLLINRTLVYTLLTMGIIGIYILVVGYLSELLHTYGNVAISLIATGIVAVLFQPLRERLQRWVNRQMYGERNDPYRVLARLSQRSETAVDPEAALAGIVETVAQALKLPYVAIELSGAEGQQPVAIYFAREDFSSAEPAQNLLRLPLVSQQEPIGEMRLAPRSVDEQFNQAEVRLLEAVTRQAGAVARAARLTSELRRSRERLVTLREEERRRIRRDLHDGLGPQLAALHIQAGAARAMIQKDPVKADEALAELRQEIQSAINDIRRLVYDLRPPRLDELGLIGAIRRQAEQAEKGGLTIRVDAPETLPPLSAAVEVAAYRITQEALTNLVRHSHAQNGCVSLVVIPAPFPNQPSMLQVEIIDNGTGIGSEAEHGVGLASMHERAEELGGSLIVEHADPNGTRVLARLPVYTKSQEEEANHG